MINTSFAGLKLVSPIIVGSNSQTANIQKIVEFEKAGAGAIVLKSLFEESIMREIASLGNDDHPEAYDYLSGYVSEKVVTDYLALIAEAKKRCAIPIIPSIACHSDGKWEEFAKRMQGAGADALELNVMSLSTSRLYKDGDFERIHYKIVENVVKMVNIPVIVKIGSNHSNITSLCDGLYARGAKAVVLFNRLFPTDIDVDRLTFTIGQALTSPADLSLPLRWTGIVSASVPQIDIAVSGGVDSWKGIAKSILSGAKAVEVASAIIREGASWITNANKLLEEWQQSKGFNAPENYLGNMNAAEPENEDKLLRTQFLKYFSEIH